MMKNTLMVFLILSTMTVTFAQDTPEKTKMIGTDLLGLLGGGIIGGFGVFKNDGKNELSFFSFYFSPENENITALGGGATYRIYRKGEGMRLFYGASVSVFSVSWDHEGQSNPVNTVSLWPGIDVGYRWIWGGAVTIAPYLGLNYGLGSFEADDGTSYEFEDGSKLEGGIGPNFGIDLGYLF